MSVTVTAAVIPAFGRPPEPMAMPGPVEQPGRTLVRLLAGGVNPVDLAIAGGRFYLELPEPPFVAGVEAVGEVLSSALHPVGTRVWCLTPSAGCLAEVFSVPDDRAHPVRDDVDPALAVAMGVAGLAGWMPVADRGAPAGGATVVVLGATGAVGQVALQAARVHGAGRIVAVGRDPQVLRRLREQGADAVAEVGEGLTDALREACPDGADLVVDCLWGAPLVAALPVLAPRGRIVQVGSAAAPVAEIPGGPLRGRRLDIRGFSVFAEDGPDLAAAHRALVEAAAGGLVGVPIRRIPLADAGEAWDLQAAGTGGTKLVLVP